MNVLDEKVEVFHVSTEEFSTLNDFFPNIGFNPFGVP